MRPDTLFSGVRIVADGVDLRGDLLLRDGLIADFGPSLGRPDGVEAIEAEGAILCPGLVDIRANLGEPGFEYRETIASGAAAASAGGVTTLAALPDSDPAIDDPALVHMLITRGRETGALTILPYGAATTGCRGEELAELGLLREAGAVAFTDGTRAIASSGMMRLVLSYARGFGARIVQHPEDPSLARGGSATEGELAARLGLPAIPAAAEAILVARDISLARLTGGAVHFAHVSTLAALDLIRAAKAEGLAVTCDTAPPYFDLNENAIGDYRTYAKLSPPLRRESDRQAVLAGLADGAIDADKRLPFAQASAGGVGLATLLAVTLAHVHNGELTLNAAITLLTSRPAALMGIDAGRIAKGAPGDLCLFHPERIWKVKSGSLPGKAQNSPFDGRALEGMVLGTWKAGRRVFTGPG
jgi:dihydroorotase